MKKSIIKIFSLLAVFFILLFTLSCKIQTSLNDSKKEEPAEVYYTINFNSNNQAATGNTASIKDKADTTVTLTANGFALDGYTFEGWNTKADGTGIGYADGASLKLTEDITLYAQWVLATIPTYTIKVTQAAHGTVTASQTVSIAGSEITITVIPDELYALDTISVKDIENNTVQLTVSPTNSNVYIFTMPDKNVSVTVSFKYIAHSITVNSVQNGTISVSTNVAVSGTEITIIVEPDPYYELAVVQVSDLPYHNQLLYSNTFQESYTFTIRNKDVEVYVRFRKVRYDIEFITNCTSIVSTQKVERDTKATNVDIQDNSECEGFLGWFTEPECINQFDFDTPITQNTTLYAKWTRFITTIDKFAERANSLNYSAAFKITNITSLDNDNSIKTSLNSLYSEKPDLLFELELDINGAIGQKAFMNCANLSRIVITGACSSIGYSVFSGCSNLQEISIPVSVTTIGGSAFVNCTRLTEITIPYGVTELGSSFCYGCTSLSSVSIPSSVTKIGDYAFGKCCNLSEISLPVNLTELGESAFYDCTSLSSVSIPSSVTKIGDYAFYKCCNLSEISLPVNLTELGKSAFSGCAKISSLTIPNGVTKINDNTFNGCSGLISLVIPSGVTEIGERAFYNCSKLSSLTIPNGITEIKEWTFGNCSGLTELNIPSGVTTIGEWAFHKCSGLKSLSIPSGITEIADFTFSNCSGLTDLIIPSGVSKIGKSAFSSCERLTSLIIPNGVTEILEGTFSCCYKLETVSLPSGITKIDRSAFANCNELKNITIPSTVTEISWWAFSDVKEVSFEEISSWLLKHRNTEKTLTITVTEDAATNANYLRNLYYSYSWYKVQEEE